MKYKIVRDDISKFTADAIVIPANPFLKEGSGTSKAIFSKAGEKELEKACSNLVEKHGKIRVGTAMPTPAFNMDASFIIHAVTPKWIDGKHNEYELLSSAYYASLCEADLLDCQSVAIPLLSSGNNGFDMNISFEVADKVITQFEPNNKLKNVYLIVYGRRVMAMLRERKVKFTENIDNMYVLTQDEQYRTPEEVTTRTLIDIGKKYLDAAIDKAIETISDPEFIKMVIDAGAEIFLERIKKFLEKNKQKSKNEDDEN